MCRLIFAVLFLIGCAGPQKPLIERFHEPTAPVVNTPAPTPSGVPADLYAQALAYYQTNLGEIKNPRYLTIVDFKQPSWIVRMWVIDMQTGAVEPLHVAHGSGSDPKNTGYASMFGNVPNSFKSSLGFYLTADTYVGKHGTELRVDGLSATNSNARSRAILVHGAAYVYDANTKAGRSEGCFAIPDDDKVRIIGQIKGGSLLFAGISSY